MLDFCPKCNAEVPVEEWLENYTCPLCMEHLYLCQECNSLFTSLNFEMLAEVCVDCYDELYDQCLKCGDTYSVDDLTDGLCEICQWEEEEEDEEEED